MFPLTVQCCSCSSQLCKHECPSVRHNGRPAQKTSAGAPSENARPAHIESCRTTTPSYLLNSGVRESAKAQETSPPGKLYRLLELNQSRLEDTDLDSHPRSVQIPVLPPAGLEECFRVHWRSEIPGQALGL